MFTVSVGITQNNKMKTRLTSVVTVKKQRVTGRAEIERLLMFNVQG